MKFVIALPDLRNVAVVQVIIGNGNACVESKWLHLPSEDDMAYFHNIINVLIPGIGDPAQTVVASPEDLDALKKMEAFKMLYIEETKGPKS